MRGIAHRISSRSGFTAETSPHLISQSVSHFLESTTARDVCLLSGAEYRSVSNAINHFRGKIPCDYPNRVQEARSGDLSCLLPRRWFLHWNVPFPARSRETVHLRDRRDQQSVRSPESNSEHQ